MILPKATLSNLAQNGNLPDMILSPIIIAAKPATMEPTPIVLVALLCWKTTKAPESATKALESTSPKIFELCVLIPCAIAIFSLLPVARIALPVSVPKNQYKSPTTIATAIIPTINIIQFLPIGINSAIFVKSVELSAKLDDIFPNPRFKPKIGRAHV